MKRALITGITGQDGSYLAEFLLGKGYKVYGFIRRTSGGSIWRIEHLLGKIELIDGDITDFASIAKALKEARPDEIYNLAAQSFVGVSWQEPIHTSEVTGLAVTKLLEAMRLFAPQARFYQASTSELFGNSCDSDGTQDESTPFWPRSPYAIAKLYAYWMVVNYRVSHGLHCSNGILFNHESPRRGIEFVTRKITDGVARIKLGLTDKIRLGNLDAKRDWGYAGDYVEAMWMMLQQEQPGDFVIATGETHSVREFIQAAFAAAGIGDWEKYIVQDPRYMRPADVPLLRGRADKAGKAFGWKPKMPFEELVALMVKEDIARLQRSIGNASAPTTIEARVDQLQRRVERLEQQR